jgi:organic hydroperoxide reductase OsmC/OhrA
VLLLLLLLLHLEVCLWLSVGCGESAAAVAPEELPVAGDAACLVTVLHLVCQSS